MNDKQHPVRVGEIRPSQLMYTYGVGAIIDLPRISVIVTGLEDWQTDPQYVHPIVEDRLLTAVRYELPGVQKLLSPPIAPDTGLAPDPFSDPSARVGIPVATFPRWMVCPRCRLLARVGSGLFTLDEDHFYPDRNVFRHVNCNKGNKPEVLPARFLVACERGHLDDFPWVTFVHRGNPCDSPYLRLLEFGASGEARDLEVRCQTCDARRRLAEAFGVQNRQKMPLCRGRRPHLRDFDPEECEHRMRTLILGASNTWFPVIYSTVAIPVQSGKLAKLVEENWAKLQNVKSVEGVELLNSIGQLGGDFVGFGHEEIWKAIEKRRKADAGGGDAPAERPDLKTPEWQVFTHFNPSLNGPDFRLQPVPPPPRYAKFIDQVLLVERLREVRAMVGFTRLDAFGELTDPDLEVVIDPAPLSREDPAWVPASEVRGEGIFIQFNENEIQKWLGRGAMDRRGDEFHAAHTKWRQARFIEPPEDGFPGMRYVLLHSFAHALIRQLALESGYATASIRERLYSRAAEKEGGPMAGILLYTAAPDSEGTLGGLVSLGQPATLERHIAQALEATRLCASDPLCAEHPPSQSGRTLHAAACHACMFAPETSCERGNKYLDRALLVQTVESDDLAFFE